uniref:DUF1618 domain-containing protein n=1 Tax=Oryza meridionalis TaxID=40149 RepID=A0A0E0EM86_9ORYZ
MGLADQIVHEIIRDQGLYRFGPLRSVTPYSCVGLSLRCYRGVQTLGSSFSRGALSFDGQELPTFVGGCLKFVDVDDGCFRSTERSPGCSITTWTLKLPGFEWEVDGTLQLEEEHWPLPSYRESPLPRITPTFPVFSMHEADVLHIILDRPGYDNKCWVITVDIKNKSSLGPYMLYKNAAAAQDCDEDGSSNEFRDSLMISTDLSKYLNIYSITGD